MRGENDNPDVGAGGAFLPSSAAVFLPTLVIVGGYALAWSGLWLAGLSGGALGRLCLIVLAVGGPFLVAHAVLRRFTTRVEVLPHAVFVHAGFPRGEPVEIPYALIRRLTVARGPVGRLTGTGTLIFEVAGGARVAAADLARPGHALAVIGRLIDEAALAFTPPVRPPQDDVTRSAHGG